MDIKLSEVPVKEMMPGYHGKMIHAKNITLAFWEVAEGATVPNHSHSNVQIMQVLEGRFEFTIDRVTKVYEPNDLAVIPSNTSHGGKALAPCKLMDVFSPVRGEYT